MKEDAPMTQTASLDSFARAKLDEMEARALRRRLVETDRYGPALARRGHDQRGG